MTDVHTEAEVVPAATTPTKTPPPTPTADVSKEKTPPAAVEHTPGGWPIVPLSLSAANTTVGTIAAASLAGGPIAGVAAAAGAVVLGGAAALRSRKPNARRAARRTAARTAARSAGRSAGLLSRGSRSGGSGGRHGASAHRRGRGRGPANGHASTGALGKTHNKGGQGAKRAAGGAGKAPGRAGQIKALRSAQQAATPYRADQRTQTTAARRAVADARRNAKAAAGKPRLSKRNGLAGRLLGGTARKARAVRDAAIAKHRAKRDAKTGSTVAARRAAIRKAPARKAARKALRRSAARFHGRRLLAALLAVPACVIGLVTTPIGRKLGIPWLIAPGPRLYRWMTRTAAEQRAARDEAIRIWLREQEEAADAEAAEDGTGGIGDRVARPPAEVPIPTNSQVSEGEYVSGFRFEEAASEMEQAANSYEPDDCMEILAMVEGLPAALTSVANVMKILAERSDSEFPLEKEVADGFSDIFGALMSAVAVADDMGPTFRQVHAQDIARHEDPRNGTEAEKGWNV